MKGTALKRLGMARVAALAWLGVVCGNQVAFRLFDKVLLGPGNPCKMTIIVRRANKEDRMRGTGSASETGPSMRAIKNEYGKQVAHAYRLEVRKERASGRKPVYFAILARVVGKLFAVDAKAADDVAAAPFESI